MKDTSTVHSPSHYTQGPTETIESIKASLGPGFIPYCAGNAQKY
jgi:hypothetical protein